MRIGYFLINFLHPCAKNVLQLLYIIAHDIIISNSVSEYHLGCHAWKSIPIHETAPLCFISLLNLQHILYIGIFIGRGGQDGLQMWLETPFFTLPTIDRLGLFLLLLLLFISLVQTNFNFYARLINMLQLALINKYCLGYWLITQVLHIK